MARCRGINPEDLPYGPGNPDYEGDGDRQRADDEADAKRNASGGSPEILSLIDAGNAGRQAGMFGHGASMNPYTDPQSPEFQEWEKHRLSTIAARLGQPQRNAA